MSFSLFECHDPETKRRLCYNILHALPDWFGIPEAIHDFSDIAAGQPMFVAYESDRGEEVGFASIRIHTEAAAELYVIGVIQSNHRRGIGRALVEAAAEFCRRASRCYLSVKTLALSDDPHYAGTHAFYRALGFEEIEVFPTLWNKENPCLLMLKPLTADG